MVVETKLKGIRGYKMIKKLLINEKNIEVLIKGDKGIVIIILTGMGCSFHEWHEITDRLGESNKVIMFHRPGLGTSQIGNEKRNTCAVAEELMDIVNHLGIKERFLLAGHSYGGLCAQHFALKYPEKLAGLVLIDSTSMNIEKLNDLDLPFLEEDSDEIWIEKCHTYSRMSKEELAEASPPELTDGQKKLPEAIRQQILDFQINPDMYKAMGQEIENWLLDGEEMRELGRVSELPLVVMGRDPEYCIELAVKDGISKGEAELFERQWHQLILEQAELSDDSMIIIPARSSHSIHLDDPDSVVEALLNKIESR
jgi:pimeloyl-ACP methyl ester carboxylesterase